MGRRSGLRNKVNPPDRQVKKVEIGNSYGIGIRACTTGPVADQADLFYKKTRLICLILMLRGEVLTVKYPAVTPTSASDLIAAWEEWKGSEINDPGKFELEMMGDGPYGPFRLEYRKGVTSNRESNH